MLSDKSRRNIKRLLKRYPDPSDPLAKRPAIITLLRLSAEDGQVAIVSGGRNCDGCESNGDVELIPAIYPAYLRAINRLLRDAEGPTWWQIEKPSVATTIRRECRDLVAEAHENGRPYTLSRADFSDN